MGPEQHMNLPQPQHEDERVEPAEAPSVDELQQLDAAAVPNGQELAQSDQSTLPNAPTDEEFFGKEAMAAYNKDMAAERAKLLSSEAVRGNLTALHQALDGRIAELDTERKGFMGMIRNLRDKIQAFMTTETAMKQTRDQVADMLQRVDASTDPVQQNKILNEVAGLKLEQRVLDDYYAATADTSPVAQRERPAMSTSTPFGVPIGAAPPRASERLSRKSSAADVHGSDYGMRPGDDAIDAQIQSALRDNYESEDSEAEDTGSVTDYDQTPSPQVTAAKKETKAAATPNNEPVDASMELPVLTADVAARELVLNPTQRTLQVLEHSYDNQANPRDAEKLAVLLAREYVKRKMPAKAREWTTKVTDPTELEYLQNDLSELPTEPNNVQSAKQREA